MSKEQIQLPGGQRHPEEAQQTRNCYVERRGTGSGCQPAGAEAADRWPGAVYQHAGGAQDHRPLSRLQSELENRTPDSLALLSYSANRCPKVTAVTTALNPVGFPPQSDPRPRAAVYRRRGASYLHAPRWPGCGCTSCWRKCMAWASTR